MGSSDLGFLRNWIRPDQLHANSINKKAQRIIRCALKKTTLHYRLSPVVVVLIPVALGMPTMTVFVPPLVCVCPAVLTRFVQLLTRLSRLSAFPSMVFSSFVQPMVGSRQASLACVVIGPKRRCTHEKKSTCQRCGRKRCSSPK
jgi:hypothetical protein